MITEASVPRKAALTTAVSLLPSYSASHIENTSASVSSGSSRENHKNEWKDISDNKGKHTGTKF
jgi:hypothetical protein